MGALEEASSVFSANHHRLLRDISKCAASRVKEPIPNLGSRYIFFFCQTCKNPLENMDNSLTSGNYLEFTAIPTLLNERLGEK